MKKLLVILIMLCCSFIPIANADFPTNPHECCINCPLETEELCFWNDSKYLYISADPQTAGHLCGWQAIVIQDNYQYDTYLYDKFDNSVCGDIYVYTEARIVESRSATSSPFDPNRPLRIVIEYCQSYSNPTFYDYNAECNVELITTTTTSLPVVTTTTTVPIVTTTTVPKTFSISGTISGDVKANISIKITGTASRNATTNQSGFYIFSNLNEGYYTITPDNADYDFEPSNYVIQNLTGNLSNMDFVSKRAMPCAVEAIYGEDSAEAEALRLIRDHVLSKTPEGQALIKLYYFWSPFIVRAMENDQQFKAEVKELFDCELLLMDKGIDYK